MILWSCPTHPRWSWTRASSESRFPQQWAIGENAGRWTDRWNEEIWSDYHWWWDKVIIGMRRCDVIIDDEMWRSLWCMMRLGLCWDDETYRKLEWKIWRSIMIIDLIFISGVTAGILDANTCFWKPNSVLAGINDDFLCLFWLLFFIRTLTVVVVGIICLCLVTNRFHFFVEEF